MMNKQMFFYIYILIVVFLSVNIFKHIAKGAPPADYIIYAIISLTLLSIISDQLIELVYGRKSPMFLLIFNMVLYVSVLGLSIYAITLSSALFDIILYSLFIPTSVMLMYVQTIIYKKEIRG
ncbi:hypothetical protein ROU88_08405 [Macrococcus capreoli]